MSNHPSPFSEEIYQPWEDATFHKPPLSYAEQIPLLEDLLTKLRADGKWIYPFADCAMVSTSLVSLYVLTGHLEAAAKLAESLERHPNYEIDLSTSILAAKGRIVAFRLGNAQKGQEIIELLTTKRIPNHLVFSLIGLITTLYDAAIPMPSDALNLCIDLANAADQKSLGEQFRNVATSEDIGALNDIAGEASYKKRHPDKP